MQAALLTAYGDVDKLQLSDVPQPKLGPRDVKVRVAAASINPVDYKTRRGDLRSWLPLELPAILGRDVSGQVVEVGSEVSEFRVGDRVMGLVREGYAEFAAGPVEAFAKLPDGLDPVEAAVLPLAGLTGAQLVEEAVNVKAGDIVLVTGALGSVGRVAVFAAKRRGAKVIAGVRARQREQAASLEAYQVVALDVPKEVDQLPALDAIADTVGGHVIEALLKKLKSGGVIGSVLGEPRGARQRDVVVHTMMTHPDPKRLEELGSAVARHELNLPVDQRYSLTDVRAAQRRAESPGVGKVLLVV
jgi:NADPH:quinone reductase-like Zn-dependent oxidoreductase